MLHQKHIYIYMLYGFMCRISKALYQIALNLKDGQKIDCANLEPRAEEKGAIATTFHV